MVVSVIIFFLSVKFNLSLQLGIYPFFTCYICRPRALAVFMDQTLLLLFGLTSYVQIIFGVILGWFVFKQLPTLYNYIGILIVISAG